MTIQDHKRHEKRARAWEKEQSESEKVAYAEVPSQEEMLGFEAKTDSERYPRHHSDHDVTRQLDEELYEACQNGNIGGG